MNLSSPKISFDTRLLEIENLFRQREYSLATQKIQQLDETDFVDCNHDYGLYLSLKAQANHHDSNYKLTLGDGLRAAKIFANLPLNKRFGNVQLTLSKAYSALGDLKNAEIRARDSLSSFRRCGDEVGQADALNELARVTYIRCDYQNVITYLEEALELVRNNPRKTAQLRGNLARIRIRTGEWVKAEEDLNESLKYNIANNEEISLAINTFSLGVLQIRSRKFIMAAKSLDTALEIISRLDLKREKIIYFEFAGELAFEKGDMSKAKLFFTNAYEKGMVISPNSALISQSARRLAEVELILDNIDDAMKYGQKALEASIKIGEKLEIGLSKKVIAQVFAAKEDYTDALEYIEQAVEIVRDVGDPWELGRILLVHADIYNKAKSTNTDKIRATYDEASRIFKSLKLDYWTAVTDFQAGVFACKIGDLSTGFKKLSRSEKVFDTQHDKVKMRAVNKYLKSLSEQAVALSISSDNEYKIFGNLITQTELSNIKSSDLGEILNILLKRIHGSRAVVYSPDFEESTVNASISMTTHQKVKFEDCFNNIIGEEISRNKPTLILDCRRDPFINDLFADSSGSIASVIVIPFKLSDNSLSYLYIDKQSRNNTLNPFTQSELNFAVGYSDLIAFKWAEIQKNKLLEDNLRLKNQLREKAAFPNIITQNNIMIEMLTQVRQVIDSNISISIEGETGTGKDVLAKAIHYNSNRRDKRFISINCAALPESLLESELFGYKRGAFTGADRDKAGLFEEADGGTFFLDEIGDMPLSLQAKVLRILEEKEMTRLGDTIPHKVDVRIISATNCDLKELMAAKTFRQDLYYRLSVMTFHLPPLRDRKEDIPLLVNHFLNGNGKKISADAMKMLVGYDWPGNIRELENEIKKLTLLTGDEKEIPAEAVTTRIASVGVRLTPENKQRVESSDDIVFDNNYTLYDYLDQHEKQFIIRALKEKRGVKKHAADLLNIPESTLRLKIKQYNIDLKKLKASL